MYYYSIRGAITVTENSADAINEASKKLINELFNANNLKNEQIVSILFTCTNDLNAVYPAVGARELGLTDCALMCLSEMDVANSLRKCLRVCVHAFSQEYVTQKDAKHVYLEGAAVLRPDIASKKDLNLIVAIDGVVASGKSSVAKAVAKELDLTYIDSGAMYRAIALHCLNKGIELEDENKVSAELLNVNLDIKNVSGNFAIFLNGNDVTEAIRTQAVAQGASKVGKILAVRKKLVQMQREIAKGKDIIMDGRDIGTDVFPDAQVKIYMTASVDARTQRRCLDLEEKGLSSPGDFETIKQEIINRDHEDITREHSPLRKAEGAVYLDTTEMDFKQSVDEIISLILNWRNNENNGC